MLRMLFTAAKSADEPAALNLQADEVERFSVNEVHRTELFSDGIHLKMCDSNIVKVV